MSTSADKDLDVVVAGYIGVDLAPDIVGSGEGLALDQWLRPGKLIETGGLAMSLGGAVANTGLAMRRFGQRVVLNGLIGRDPLGDIAIGLLRKWGLFPGVRRTKRASTAYGIVLSPPGNDRMFLECPGCNSIFTARDVDYEAVTRSRLFHFGYPTLMEALYVDNGSELERLLSLAREVGTVTSLDMTLPDPDSPSGKADWVRILERVLPYIDIFVPSIEELLYMMDRKAYERAVKKARGGDVIDAIPGSVYPRLANRVIKAGVKVLMVKAGHSGIYLRTGDVEALRRDGLKLSGKSWNQQELWVPAFKADPKALKNACGAGDAAVGGFLTAILEGETIERAGRFAVLAGRDSLYGVDALGGLRDWGAMKKEC